jgi:galactokinase
MTAPREGRADHLHEAAELRAMLVASEPVAARDPGAVRFIRAPGRVNLIGEHTDYNLGLVLPAAIDLEIRVAFVPTADRRVELLSLAMGERDGFSLDQIGPRTGGWIDYVAGVAKVLLEAGVPVRGLRGVVAATLPTSAGLSSSAALELASALALTDPPGAGLQSMTLAQLAQRAENEYVGVQCGLMDQFAVANGEPDRALLFDCRSLAWRPIVLPSATHGLVVCDTGSSRRLDQSAYNARRSQCEHALEVVAATYAHVESLRDVDLIMLEALRGRLGEEAFRRGRHVVTENARTLRCAEALEAGDLATVGRLWAASHTSLRDDFEVSSPELDALVEIAVASPGVIGARMTGAGFGGCVVALVSRDAVDVLRTRVIEEYPARTGLTPRVYPVEAVAGAGRLEEAAARVT